MQINIFFLHEGNEQKRLAENPARLLPVSPKQQ